MTPNPDSSAPSLPPQWTDEHAMFRKTARDFVGAVLAGTDPTNGRDWQTIRDSVVEENDAIYILLGVFASFALVASVFIIANAIAGQVQSQQRDIGLRLTEPGPHVRGAGVDARRRRSDQDAGFAHPHGDRGG